MEENVRRGLRTLRDEGVGAFANAIARFVRFQREQLPKRLECRRRTLQHRFRYGTGAPSPYRLVHVDPADVEYLLAPRFQRQLSDWGTHVVAGDWDRRNEGRTVAYATEFEHWTGERQLVRFENYTFYESLSAHFEDGVPWEETAIYRWFTDVDHGDVRYRTDTDLRQQLAYLDDLYDAMRRDGYRTQSALEESGRWYSAAPPEHHEVMVNVGRDGEIVFDDGRHRFCLAKLLGFERVPVRVFVRHAEWQHLRSEVAGSEDRAELLATTGVDGSHPDLVDV